MRILNKNALSRISEFQSVASIEIKDIFSYINSSFGYSNSCFSVYVIVDLAYQLMVLTKDNLFLNTDIAKIMKKKICLLLLCYF